MKVLIVEKHGNCKLILEDTLNDEGYKVDAYLPADMGVPSSDGVLRESGDFTPFADADELGNIVMDSQYDVVILARESFVEHTIASSLNAGTQVSYCDCARAIHAKGFQGKLLVTSTIRESVVSNEIGDDLNPKIKYLQKSHTVDVLIDALK